MDLHRLENVERLPPYAIFAGCLALLLLTGWFDRVVGWRIDLTALYLIPVAGGAWILGIRFGLAVALMAAAVAVASNAWAGVPAPTPLLHLWDFLIALAVFAATAALAAAVRGARSSREELKLEDPLTKLPTSDVFYDRAGHQVKTAVRYHRPVTLAYIGVDNFNALNARFGHRTGDGVLISIAQTLRQQIRETDLVARLGGDEFGILFPETGDEAGRNAVEKVRESLTEATEGWPISFSIGAATCDRTACTLDELIRRAEDLMRAIKSSGRDGVRTETIEASASS